MPIGHAAQHPGNVYAFAGSGRCCHSLPSIRLACAFTLAESMTTQAGYPLSVVNWSNLVNDNYCSP
jgi:hypothetical protein